MNANIRRLGLFFLTAFAVIVVDVTYWQVIDASTMQNRPDNYRLQTQAARVQRGIIRDRNGIVLAGRTIDAQGFVHRYYTDPTLSQVIGYDSQRYGKSELEKTYDGYLTGQVVGNNWKSFLDQLEHKTVVGNDLTLTIDDNLQRRVAAIMPNAPSAAIVSDPRTGEILSMVSKPSFDAGQINNSNYWSGLLHDPNLPLINRDVNGYYPPGSTFKIVTLSAALDSGVMALSNTFSGTAATGPLTVNFHTFPAKINNLPAGVTSVDLTQALLYSDNIVFAQVGLAVGAARFLDYTRRFGLDQPTPFDIPVFESHTQIPREVFDKLELASTAFGQGGLHVTPLQMLMATEAEADRGAIPRPILVKSVTAPDGSTVTSASPGTLYTPISSSTADLVKGAMVQVVAHGSGFLAQIPGIQVAGKTGTAEPGSGSPHAWFTCFAPADHPRVAVTVLVEHGGEGFSTAAPLAKQILQAALSVTH